MIPISFISCHFQRILCKPLFTENDTYQEDITLFLNNIDLPHLTTEQTETLDTPITPVYSMVLSLNHIPNNKVPGPDGFPTKFYKYLAT